MSLEPPLLIEHITPVTPSKKRWFTVRVFFAITTFIALAYAGATKIPIHASIHVPSDFREEMRHTLLSANLPATTGHFYRSTSRFRSLPYLGLQVWFSEGRILSDVQSSGYACRIEYQPLIESYTWEKTVGNPDTIGLK